MYKIFCDVVQWWEGKQVVPKRRYTDTQLQSVTTQQHGVFISPRKTQNSKLTWNPKFHIKHVTY